MPGARAACLLLPEVALQLLPRQSRRYLHHARGGAGNEEVATRKEQGEGAPTKSVATMRKGRLCLMGACCSSRDGEARPVCAWMLQGGRVYSGCAVGAAGHFGLHP
eukprot:scaffold11390_cov18-Tisochrysis_lutea.AAC.1